MQRTKHLFIVSGLRLGDTNNGQSRTAEAGDAEANMRNGLFGCMVVACVGMVPACGQLNPACTAGVTLAGAPWLAAVCAEDEDVQPPVTDGNNVADGGCVGELCKPQPDMTDPAVVNPDFPPGMGKPTEFTKKDLALFPDGWYGGGHGFFGSDTTRPGAPFALSLRGNSGSLPADDFSCSGEVCWHNCGKSMEPGSQTWCYRLRFNFNGDEKLAVIDSFYPGRDPMLPNVQPSDQTELIRGDWRP